MTRCQEAAFACVLLTVPRPWRGSLVCSARVCEVCAVIWPCVYRDTRVSVSSLRADGPGGLEAHGTRPARPADTLLGSRGTGVFLSPAFCQPVGTERCCRQSTAARESCSFWRLRMAGEAREGALLGKYLRSYPSSSSHLACSFFHFVLLPELLDFLSEREKSV